MIESVFPITFTFLARSSRTLLLQITVTVPEGDATCVSLVKLRGVARGGGLDPPQLEGG